MSALMPVQSTIVVTPPANLSLLSGISAAFHYPLHGDAVEGTGYGAPDLTVNGAVGTLWTANFAEATPDGAAHYLTSAVGNAVLNEVFDMTDLHGQHIILGWEQQWDGNIATAEAMICWGRDVGTAGTKGCWQIGTGTTEQINFIHRGAEGTNFTTTAVQNSAMADTDRYACVLTIIGATASTVDLHLIRYKYGTGVQSPGANTGINLLANAAIANPGVNSDYALTLFARKTTGATYDRFMGATAGSNALISNVWGLRVPTPIIGLAENCLDDMVASPGQFPISARSV